MIFTTMIFILPYDLYRIAAITNTSHSLYYNYA